MSRVVLLTATVGQGKFLQRANPGVLGETLIVTPRMAARGGAEGLIVSVVFVDAAAVTEPGYDEVAAVLRHSLRRSKQPQRLRIFTTSPEGWITGWTPA